MASVPQVIKGMNAIDRTPIEYKLGEKVNPTVVVFLSATCPCSDSHIPYLKKLTSEFPQINFLAIHSNMDENEKTTQAYFKSVNLPFAVIEDSEAKLADTFKAFKTPHAFILSKENQILYEGGVTSSAKAHQASHFHLRDALLDLTSGKEIKVKEVRTLGCMISREKEQ
jgi:hypothetical protein